jgi:hypothetical protein
MKYPALIEKGKLRFIRLSRVMSYLKRNDGVWVNVEFEKVGTTTAKSREQLGFYWGLLLPEIHSQLVADGHTIPISWNGVSVEIPITKDSVHELLTSLCGQVGDGGQSKRISDCNKIELTRYIDNVIMFACTSLCMNKDRLESARKGQR